MCSIYFCLHLRIERGGGACKAIHLVYLATNYSSNCSRSDVNERAQLLRKYYSMNFSSIRSGPYYCEVCIKVAVTVIQMDTCKS